jgi:hypothetical protein
MQNFSLEILLKYEYDTTDPKHNIKQIFICALAHKIIYTTWCFLVNLEKRYFQFAFVEYLKYFARFE